MATGTKQIRRGRVDRALDRIRDLVQEMNDSGQVRSLAEEMKNPHAMYLRGKVDGLERAVAILEEALN